MHCRTGGFRVLRVPREVCRYAAVGGAWRPVASFTARASPRIPGPLLPAPPAICPRPPCRLPVEGRKQEHVDDADRRGDGVLRAAAGAGAAGEHVSISTLHPTAARGNPARENLAKSGLGSKGVWGSSSNDNSKKSRGHKLSRIFVSTFHYGL